MSPAVVGRIAYAVSDDPGRLYSFDASGTRVRSEAPKVCTPLWTAGQTFDPVQQQWVGDDLYSSPTVANGVVYVSGAEGALFAYDAAGQQNCSGTPRVCAPLWTTAITGVFTSAEPVVANGVVYVGAEDGTLLAFDAAGKSHCNSTTRAWTGADSVLRAYRLQPGSAAANRSTS